MLAISDATRTLNRSKRIYLPPNVQIRRNPMGNSCEGVTSNGRFQVFKTLYDRDIGVYEELKVNKGILPSSMDESDRHGVVGNYFRADNVDIQELHDAIKSAVRMPATSGEDCASGVIVRHKDKKYLFTALHISSVNDVVFGYKNNFLVQNGKDEFSLSKEQLIYPKVYSYSSFGKAKLPSNAIFPTRTPLADLAIFNYTGNISGIPVQMDKIWSLGEPLFSIGFPAGDMKNYYAENPSPLISFGFAVPEKENVQGLVHLQELLHVNAAYPQSRKMFYTGVSLPGNSGCALVNLNGELKAILCGQFNEFADVKGYTVLFPPQEVFRRVLERDSYYVAA